MNKTNYILVHAAWLGAWSWQGVERLLNEQGHNVFVPDLPGHGADTTPVESITLNSYVETILKLIDSIDGRIVLVGHSFAGVVISQVAEARPNKIESLVYVAGFLLSDGLSFMDVVSGVTDSVAVKHFSLSDDGLYASIEPSAVHDAFAHDVPNVLFEPAVDLMVPEPAKPLQTPLNISTEGFGAVPRFYIQTTQDKAVPLALQNAMIKALPVKQIYSIDSSHSPNFSHPELLTDYLLDIGNKQEF